MSKKEQELLIARNKFLGKCPLCGQKLHKVDDVNLLRCENSFCRGMEVYQDGIPHYEPYVRLLNEKRMKVYNHLFK